MKAHPTEPEPGSETIVVASVDASARLDAYLARRFSQHSRARWQALIDEGMVTVDGAPARAALKVAGGMRIDVVFPPVRKVETLAEALSLSVVFEDEWVIVIDKAAGMVVHPAAGVDGGTVVNALLHHVPDLEIGGEERPGIVHRLDKDTSGLLVCAKTDAALRALQRSFQERSVEKRYRAWCFGRPKEKSFELVTGHARHPRDRKRFTTRVPPPAHGVEGPVRRAAAHYTVVASRGGVSEIEVKLETGRTHQIRAQLSDIGHPILADVLYGGDRGERRVDDALVRAAVTRLTRHALHAEKLAFPHPTSGEMMRFVAPLPPELMALYEVLRRSVDDEEESG